MILDVAVITAIVLIVGCAVCAVAACLFARPVKVDTCAATARGGKLRCTEAPGHECPHRSVDGYRWVLTGAQTCKVWHQGRWVADGAEAAS